jgi:hypothetical protein
MFKKMVKSHFPLGAKHVTERNILREKLSRQTGKKGHSENNFIGKLYNECLADILMDILTRGVGWPEWPVLGSFVTR